MQIVERREHPDREEEDLRDADAADLLEKVGERRRADVLEDDVRARQRRTPAEQADQVRVSQSVDHHRLALEAREGTFAVDAVGTKQLHRRLAEELAVPRGEDLVPRAAAERLDDDEGRIDVVAAPQTPARGGSLRRACGLLDLCAHGPATCKVAATAR